VNHYRFALARFFSKLPSEYNNRTREDASLWHIWAPFGTGGIGLPGWPNFAPESVLTRLLRRHCLRR